MKKMTVFYIFAALFFIVGAAFHVLPSEGPKVTLYSDIIAVIAAALPVIAFFYVFSYFEKGSKKVILLTFTVGLFLWLLGEVMWLYYEGLMEIDAFPSAADFFWVLGYPTVLAALILQYRTVKVRLETLYVVGISAVILIGGLVVGILLGYPIAVYEEFTVLEKVVSMFYPIADLFLLYTALLITGLYWAGKLGYAWLLIAVGIIFYAVGDLWFAYLEWKEIYPVVWWHPVDFAWIIGDLLVFLGAVKYRISFEELV
ncbi:MAG: hypothetical protein HXS46_18035 [Theionarchaea archaeon]|nr:MAG: hypothetical protein AYK18_13450 [Theionarchaea archaeon DG-70]MBU7012586.1 hypothetical protein [Theionarchaea archaeon]